MTGDHDNVFSRQVIAAEGEHKASRALRHAAEVIAGSPAALQVIICFLFVFFLFFIFFFLRRAVEVIAWSPAAP